MHPDLIDLVTFAQVRQADLLKMSQARAKDAIYQHYSSHRGPGGGGEGSASDEDFEAMCQEIGKSGSAHLYYLPAKGGGRGFHKFLSRVCDGDELPATTRIYINC